jgi:hypothetical protein
MGVARSMYYFFPNTLYEQGVYSICCKVALVSEQYMARTTGALGKPL